MTAATAKDRPISPVLVVEDNADVRDAMLTALEMYGFNTMGAENGAHALAILERGHRRPCLILLDLMMPVMDGIEFRRRQLADPACADIPVVVVSAYDRRSSVQELPVAEFVPKPVDFDRLLASVERHCHSAA